MVVTQRLTGTKFEINSLLLDHQRPLLHQGMDGADVFVDDAHKKHLQGQKEEDADDQWGDTDREFIPKNQLVHQVGQRHQNRHQSAREAGKGHQAQWNLGEVGDGEHGQIVKGKKIVLRDSPFAPGLMVGNIEMRETGLGNHAAKIRVGIVELFDDVYDLAIIKTESGEIFISFHSGEPLDEPVVSLPNPEHQAVFFARLLDADDYAVAFLPLSDHLHDQLGGILQVRHDSDDRISSGLIKGVHGRADVSEVTGIANYFYILIAQGERLELAVSIVGGSVVDKNVFITVSAERCNRRPHALVEFANVSLLVVTRGDNGDGPARGRPSGVSHGKLVPCSVYIKESVRSGAARAPGYLG